MNTTFQNFKNAFVAEHIKKRGTGIYVLAVIMGIIIPLLVAVVTVCKDAFGNGFDGLEESRIPYNYYMGFIYDLVPTFISFFLPVLIIINASRLAQLDHKTGGWQLMETQPVNRFSIYFSKFSVLLVSNIIAIVCFFSFALLFCWILTFIVEVPKDAILDFPAADILNLSFRIFAGAFFITVFQYILSVMISGFIWPLLIGFFGLIVTPILNALNMSLGWQPFDVLFKVSTYKEGSDVGNWLLYTEKLSLVLGLLLMMFGFWFYKDKFFKRAFLSSGKRIAFSMGTLSVFAAITCFLLYPNSYELNSRTILAGKIDSEMPFQKAYLVHPTIGDTLAVIDIKNKKFSNEIKSNMPLDKYMLTFGDVFNIELVMSDKDSLFLDIKTKGNDVDVKYFGTRLAEHKFKDQNEYNFKTTEMLLENDNYVKDSEMFLNQLAKDWQDDYSQANSFKTADNFIPKQDFIDKTKKLTCLKYLGYLNSFLDKRAALYPNEKVVFTNEIKNLKSKISLHDESLISEQSYLDYLLHEISKNDKRDIDKKTKEIEAIAKLKPGVFKNRLLYSYLKTNLEEANSQDERTALVSNYAGEIKDPKLVRYIQDFYKIAQRLGKGNPARDFFATSLDGKPVSLSDLKGKFVAIDMWATWCGPCNNQSPYFEKMALKYKNENVHFVAMSVDKNIKKWFVSAKAKSKSVLQWHANDSEGLSKDYNLQTIPRFILIDGMGKIYNSKMPFPTEDAFEMVLRKALGMKEEI